MWCILHYYLLIVLCNFVLCHFMHVVHMQVNCVVLPVTLTFKAIKSQVQVYIHKRMLSQVQVYMQYRAN